MHTNALVPRLLGTAVHESEIRFTTDAREGNCSNFLTRQLQPRLGVSAIADAATKERELAGHGI